MFSDHSIRFITDGKATSAFRSLASHRRLFFDDFPVTDRTSQGA
jgi:hypothetical protein